MSVGCMDYLCTIKIRNKIAEQAPRSVADILFNKYTFAGLIPRLVQIDLPLD